MESIWTKTEDGPEFKTLKGDIKTDVLVIGGGIAGIFCSHMLRAAGVENVLVEADRICSGITKNTTAKLTYQHGLIYDKIIRKYGLDTAKLYLHAQQSAMNEVSKVCKTYECEFEQCDSFVYSLNDREKIEKEVKVFNRLGSKADFCEKTELPFPVAGAVRVKNQAQFHPLKLLFKIAKNLDIYENTKVTEFKPDSVITKYGKIRANKIIVATHFPFLNKHGSYILKMYQNRSYVLALKNAVSLNGMYVDESETGLSFRNYKDLLLLGGGSHRTGKKGTNWAELSETAEKYYPESTEACRWATQDCVTLDSIPYIGQYSKRTPDLYVATGFNKWGMSSAMVSAMILCDMVQGKENEYAKVFSPSRSMLHLQLAANAAEALVSILTPTVPRCPHMGCALKYNPQEHSWDCPCHGSRFTETGELIDNPSGKACF